MKEILHNLSEIVHELQRERGCAAMYLASHGQLFKDRINEQFTHTDRSVKTLRDMYDGHRYPGIKKQLAAKIDLTIKECSNLSEFRSNLNNLQITPRYAIDHYSHSLIDSLLLIMLEVALSIDAKNHGFVSAFNAFLQWKECTGQERALGVCGIVEHRFGDQRFVEHLVYIFSEQDIYRNICMVLANEQQKQLINKLLRSDAYTRIGQIHQELKDYSDSKELHKLTPETWFALITNKIDLLHTVEKQIINGLVEPSSEIRLSDESQKSAINASDISAKYGKIVSALPLFSGIDKADMDPLLYYGQIRKYDKGTLLFLEGERVSRLYIILDGWIKIFRSYQDGEELILQMLSSGDSVMESAIFLGGSFPVNARAIKDSVMLSIPAPVVRKHLSSNPALTNNMLSIMSNRSQNLMHRIHHLRTKSVDERTGWFLLKLLLKQSHSSTAIQLPYDKSSIASYLNMSRETFSRSLKRLQKKGFQIENNVILAPSLNALCEFCDHNINVACPLHGSDDCPQEPSISATK